MPYRRLHVPAAVLFGLIAIIGASHDARAQDARAPFTVQATDGAVIVGKEVTLNVTSPAAGSTYVWSFGDGSQPEAGASVKHTFTTVDDFRVEVSAQGTSGQTSLGTQVVQVLPEFRGAFASDLDGQFTPADEFQLVVVVRAPGLKTMSLRTGGALLSERSASYDLGGDENWLQLPTMRVADEQDPIIQEELLKKPGSGIKLDGGAFTLAMDYTTPSGRQATLAETPPVRDFFHPDQTLSITYPQIAAVHGLPTEDASAVNYYMHGDTDFSHTTDYYVRLLALEFGRRGGAWPDDPAEVAKNIFTSINALLDDGDPAEFNNDYNLARLWANGTLSMTHKNDKYICIAQAYLFTGLARTLGIPAREINNAVGEPRYQRDDGVWEVRWWQEAGLELWYDNAWHYFDTYLGITDRHAYLERNLIFQSWNAFSPQATEFMTVNDQPTGLKGHSFNAWPGNPPQWSFLEEGVRPGIIVDGMIGGPDGGPVTAIPDGAILAGRPAAAGITDLPLAVPSSLDIMAGPPATP